MNRILINPERSIGAIDRNLFGGFAEHLGRCIYGGIYDPASPHADELGLRTDVIEALQRLRMPVMRYPGGNFVSGYRWRDGVGAKEERPARLDLAWHVLESNHFGTNEFIQFCRKLNTEPYFVVNCGDGDTREARDWVEYCNGTQPTALVKLRQQHGFEEPHRILYWGIGNEVDGFWQIGFKTPQEYARAFTEFGKVMKWADPNIKLIAAAGCTWETDFVERGQLLLEQAGNLVDYMAIHWYVGNPTHNFENYMALSELFEERLSAYEGLIRAGRLANRIQQPIYIAVDEWNVNYRAGTDPTVGAEEIYNLEDALVVAMHLNAFIRHASMVKMTNLAQIVNVIAPIRTRLDGLVLQTIFYPFELYSQWCGDTALDVFWTGDTFSAEPYGSLRVLDIAASLNSASRKITLFIVNRSQDALETTVTLTEGNSHGEAEMGIVNGADLQIQNTFEQPNQVATRYCRQKTEGSTFTLSLEPHSITAVKFQIQ